MADTQSVRPKIVVIGGGTGSFTLLSSLKHFVRDITAVVNMVDDGGSTGKLRDELGALPPGDVRQCLVALSDAPEYMRELFNFRFDDGALAGHSFGNLFISALEKMNDSFADSIEIVSKVLNVQGQVQPVTLEDTVIEMELDDAVVRGQANIEESKFDGSFRPRFSLSPQAKINPKADEAIRAADVVVIAPGNLYSSLLPALLTEGMSDALAQTGAHVIVVSNLVNKKYQTNGFTLSDYVQVIESAVGSGVIDYVIYNNAKPPRGLLEKYAADGELPLVADTEEFKDPKPTLIGEALISDTPVKKAKNDALMKTPRNFIRHDADKVSRIIMRIYFS